MMRSYAKDEKGQSILYMVVVLLAVSLVAVFAIDFGIANYVRTQQGDVLQQSLAKCLEPACALKVKNSDTPGRTMCEQLVSYLREEGYDGELVAYYYEPSRAESGLDEDKRIYVFGAQLQSDVSLVFGRAYGTDEVQMGARAFSYSVPYAQQKVYTPPTIDNGFMRVPAGDTTGSWTYASTPAAMGGPDVASEIEEQLELARAKAGAA